jgi:methionyl-tRNA formyltransferase
MNIIFMGTPEFAVLPLCEMAKNFDVTAVFTRPDKPKGRGMELAFSPVKQKAMELGLPVVQPETLKTESAALQIKAFEPDLIAVVAYGMLLPEAILNIPKFGCVNAHASVLPKLRGASPIQHAVLNGDKQTGITTMLMEKGLDTGNILETSITDIDPNETALALEKRLSQMAASLIVSTAKKAFEGKLEPKEQAHSQSTYAPVITKEMGRADFSKPASYLYSQIRAFGGWPGVFALFGQQPLKIHAAAVVDSEQFAQSETDLTVCGRVFIKNNKLFVVCANKTVAQLLELQQSGRKRQSAAEFLNGARELNGAVLK